MERTPDQHDPDWPKYPETILHFSSDPPLSIDLRAQVREPEIAALERIGLAEPFAVLTAFDPLGRNLGRDENDRLASKLDARLREMNLPFTRVDACSPDGAHCECSVAVRMTRDAAVALAAEFQQVALFWFDGVQFWIVAALDSADPIALPRSS